MIAREKLILRQEKKLTDLQQTIALIHNIPLQDVVVELSLDYLVQGPLRAMRGKFQRQVHQWIHEPGLCLCIPQYFNEEAVVVDLLCGRREFPLTYAVGRARKGDGPFFTRIKFNNIQGWRLPQRKELALHIGSGIKSGIFEDALSGKVKLKCTSSSTPMATASGTPT